MGRYADIPTFGREIGRELADAALHGARRLRFVCVSRDAETGAIHPLDLHLQPFILVMTGVSTLAFAWTLRHRGIALSTASSLTGVLSAEIAAMLSTWFPKGEEAAEALAFAHRFATLAERHASTAPGDEWREVVVNLTLDALQRHTATTIFRGQATWDAIDGHFQDLLVALTSKLDRVVIREVAR